MSGRTDRDSNIELLVRHGVDPSEANLVRFWSTLVDRYDTVPGGFAANGHVFVGAKGALVLLANTPDILQSVSTGNLRLLLNANLQRLTSTLRRL